MLALMVRSLASGEISGIFGRLRRAAIVYTLAAVAAACGVGFLIAAGFMLAARRFGAVAAATGFGAGFIVFAVLVVLIYAAVEARRRRRRRKKARQAELSDMLGAAALAALPTLFGSRSGVLKVLAPFAAIAAYEVYKENRARGPRKPPADED
jgi:heme/copper-type cytochrome/quinol oxidase subunit 2